MELYPLSMLSQYYDVIFDHIVSEPGHVRELVDGLNSTYKSYLFQWMATVQITDSNIYYIHMVMHSSTSNADVSLAW